MTFVLRRNRLTTHFYERIPVVKRRISAVTYFSKVAANAWYRPHHILSYRRVHVLLCRALYLMAIMTMWKFNLEQATKAQRESRGITTLSLTLVLDGGGWSTPRPGRFTHGEKTRYPLSRRLGRPQDRSGKVRKISPPPGFEPRTVLPVPGPAETRLICFLRPGLESRQVYDIFIFETVSRARCPSCWIRTGVILFPGV
jgi:hypothetical protein